MKNRGLYSLAFAALMLSGVMLIGCKNTKSENDIFTILSFNDFHGRFVPDSNELMCVSGCTRLVETLNQLGRDSAGTMVLCNGDNFSGGYFSVVTGRSCQRKLYECCKVKYSSVGNHEFDWGVDSLRQYVKRGDITYISANIFADREYKTRPDWLKPYVIENVSLKSGKNIRVAIIGLSPVYTKQITRLDTSEKIFFSNPYTAAKNLMVTLKDSADVYIALAHVGMSMKDGEPVFDPEEQADSLPYVEGLSAIIAGHSHNVVHGHINGIPVVEAGCYGNYVGKLELEISNGKVISSAAEVLSTASTIPDPEMEKMIKGVMAQYGLSEIVAQAKANIPCDPKHKEHGFMEMGAMITTAYSDKFKELMPNNSKVVIGLCNAGAIRMPINVGDITALKAGNVLPFGGELLAFEITGKFLKEYFQYGIFGVQERFGTVQSHDLEIVVKDDSVVSIIYLPTKKEITDNDKIIAISESYLVKGGDQYPKLTVFPAVKGFNSQAKEKRNPTLAFIDYLRIKKVIDLSTAVRCELRKQ